MNPQRYRVIFSQVRGIWVAVQETARGGRGPRSAAPDGPPAPPAAAARPAPAPVAAALALLLAASPGHAQIIPDAAAPGHERPTVLRSANGTPAIHIQTPSAAGVSRNRYQQFDIGQQGERGAILNNSRTGVQSQIGGALAGNPWLAKGSARVIVNEIQSASQSRLSGALEVAGQRADVVIANPSGLVVNGLTLINAAGLTLAGGQPIYRADGSLEAFRVQQGSIQVEGRGLDASQADYAQVLARAITLNAGIWAQDLRVVTGAGQLAADSMQQPLNADGAPAEAKEKPQFALDVAQLGGMYARKIMLIGTEAGLGVRNAGVLLADAGPLTLSTSGQLRNAGVAASQGTDAELQLSARGIDNGGRLGSQRGMVLADGGGETSNAGGIEAGHELVAQAGQLVNQAGGTITAPRLDIMAARLDNAGHIAQTGTQALAINSLAIANTGDKALLGAPTANTAVQATPAAPPGPEAQPTPAAQPQPAAPQSPAPAALASGQIHVVQRLTNTGLLTANGTTDVKAIHSFANSGIAHLGYLHSEGLLDNRKGTLQMQRLTGAQASVLNQGGSIHVPGDLRLVARQLDNTGGAIASARHLTVEVPAITNDAGTLSAGGDLTVQGQTLENQRGAQLVSQTGRMRLTLDGAFNNQQGRATAQLGLEIGSASLNNAGGTLRTTGERSPLTITSGAGVDNSAGGLIESSGDLQLFAGADSVNNSTGILLAQQDLLIQSRGLVDNSQGHLQAGRKLSLQDAGVAGGAPLAQATQTLSNQGGRIFSAGSLHIRNQALAGAGRLDALGEMKLEFAGDITHQGTTATNARLRLETAGKLTNQGQLLGGTDTELEGAQIDNRPDAQIGAAQKTSLKATQDVTNRGLVDGQDTRVDGAGVNNIGTGRIFGDHVSMAAQRLENRPEDGGGKAPVIASRQDMDLGVPVVINQGGALLQSMGSLRLGASLDAKRMATGDGRELRNTGARIDVQGDIQFDKRVVDNLNAGLETEPLAELINGTGEDLIAFPGKPPESSRLYKEVPPLDRVPYFSHKGDPAPGMGDPNGKSDGRMFKPVYIDKFPFFLPAAFTEHQKSSQQDADSSSAFSLQLEPRDSPRFAQFEIPVPPNYTGTPPDPLQFGGFKDDSGQMVWGSPEEKRAYDAAFMAYQNSLEAAKKLHDKILRTMQEYNRYLDSSRDYDIIKNVKLSIRQDKVKDTIPGKIEAGGNIKLPGPFNNIDSIITAGGSIDATGSEKPQRPNNQATMGQQIILTQGDAIRYYWRFSGGISRSQHRRQRPQVAYSHTTTKTFPLPTVVFKQHHSYTPGAPGGAHSNTGNSTQRPTPVVREQVRESGERVRTLDTAAAVPQNSLYVVKPENPNRPLVETDPAFTRGRQWTSSDQMLGAFDAARLQKRLGDGYYEQQLVQQQMGLLTGRRFLGDYSDDDAQYQALLQSGATFAKAHGLRPGVALSAAQMAELTSDLAWLVEEKVPLPDGSQQTVLVPKVYVVARSGDLDVQGALISADQLVIKTEEDVQNTGTLAGRRLVGIAARDVNSPGGHIVGKMVELRAKRDINMAGGTATAGKALLAIAQRDINAESTTSSTPGSGTVVDRKAAFRLMPMEGEPSDVAAVPPEPGQAAAPSGLRLLARRDLNLAAVQIGNAVKDSETTLHAQRDINLSTIGTAHQEGVAWNRKNYFSAGSSREIGTEIHTQGLTQILANDDINARAVQAQTTGHLDVDAGGSVRLLPGQATRWLNDAYHSKRSSFLGSSSNTLAHRIRSSEAQPSSFFAESIHIKAGQDIDATSSALLAIGDISLNAKGKVNLLASPESASWQRQQHSRRSGVFGDGGLGLTIGKQRQSDEQSMQSTASAPSMVRSLTGNVVIQAGSSYRQIGSDVVADEGNIDAKAKHIEITGTPQTAHGSTRSSFRQSGLGFSFNSPVIGMAQTASSLADAASQTSSGRMQALAAGAAALNVYNLRQDLQKLATGDLGLRAELMLGRSRSSSQSSYSSSTMRQSQVLAPRGNVNLTATGGGEQSKLRLQDSQVDAGKVAKLVADNKIHLSTTPDTRSDSSRSSSRSAGFGISLGAGGPAIIGSGSRGEGRADSEDQMHRQTQVKAAERVEIHSGGDMAMDGASIHAPHIKGRIGGKLKIYGLQDSSSFDGSQSNQAGSFGLGMGSASASGGYNRSQARGNYASVNQASSIFAGDGGFDFEVGGRTELGGSVIASSQAAIDHHRNRLVTAAVITSDIGNRSDYDASGIDISGGFTTESKKQARSPGSDTVTDAEHWAAQNQGRSGVSGAGAGFSRSQGRERSITRSGISHGEVIITDEAAQRALTGQSAAEAVASLNRDVRADDPSQGLTKKWDGQRLMDEQVANAKIAAAFGQQASRAIGDHAKQQMDIAADLRQQAQQDPVQAAEIINKAEQIEKNWGGKGVTRLLTHGVAGALSAGFPGAIGSTSGALTARFFADTLRENNVPSPLADTLTALASTFTGVLTGKSAGGSAAFNEVVNNHLKHDERLLFNKSLKSCYVDNNDTACNIAFSLKEKDEMSDRLLANAVATCTENDCNKISNYIQEKMREVRCPIPHSCADIGNLLDYWKVTQSKAQGITPIYPESWILDAKMLLDLGRYGIKFLNSASRHPQSIEFLEALKQLKNTEINALEQATPGAVNFMGDKDIFFRNASRRRDIDINNTFDVIAHGEKESIRIFTPKGPITVDQRIAKKLIRNSAGYKSGQPIRLLSCETGACDTGFAQNLANKMGVPVQAPTDIVWAYPNGRIIIAPRTSNNPASTDFHRPNLSLQGKFKTFFPGNNKP